MKNLRELMFVVLLVSVFVILEISPGLADSRMRYDRGYGYGGGWGYGGYQYGGGGGWYRPYGGYGFYGPPRPRGRGMTVVLG